MVDMSGKLAGSDVDNEKAIHALSSGPDKVCCPVEDPIVDISLVSDGPGYEVDRPC